MLITLNQHPDNKYRYLYIPIPLLDTYTFVRYPYNYTTQHSITLHNITYMVHDIGRSTFGRKKNFFRPYENEIKVSFFRNFKITKPTQDVLLDDWLLTDFFKKEVEAIRREADKDRRRALKSRLPAITPSGIFSERRINGLIRHSGIICIDIDAKDNPAISDFNALKSIISDMDGLYYAGLSASGNGLFLMYRIAYPDKHLEHFRALVSDLKQLNIMADTSCSDVCRIRFASFDANPIYNPDASDYRKTQTLENPAPNIGHSPNQSLTPSQSLTTHRVRQLVEQIERSHTNIADHYTVWHVIGCALASEFQESGRHFFHAISKQSAKYQPDQCDKQYDYCIESCQRTTIKTLFWYCKNNGIFARRYVNDECTS